MYHTPHFASHDRRRSKRQCLLGIQATIESEMVTELALQFRRVHPLRSDLHHLKDIEPRIY